MMAKHLYDRELLASKIRWEGGVLAALDYGLRPDDIDDAELRNAWARLRDVHAELRPLMKDFERRLSSPSRAA